MEKEEREAQSAKLQELIRRGTPEDLREANQLMKIMTGYDTRSKVDYRAKAAEEVAKIQQKARLLEERLAQFKPGDKMADGDVFSELASALSSAQPKIQKMCEEESEDHEAVAKLLEINDAIHRTFQRYRLLKKGDFEGAAKLADPNFTPSASAGGKGAAGELSLIDFDDAAADTNGSGSQGASQASGSGLENDLLGLSLGETSSYGQTGGIALGFGANTSMLSFLLTNVGLWLTVPDIPGPALLSSVTQNNSAGGNYSASTSTSPAPPPGFSNFSAFSSAPSSKTATPKPVRSAFSPPASKPVSNDPFAQLASLGSKPATPTPAAPQNNDDDEWSFSSALPPEAPAQPREHTAVINNTNLKIDFKAFRAAEGQPPVDLLMLFSNNTPFPVTELHFQLAVTKVCFCRYYCVE